MVTPVNAVKLKQLLLESHYDETETNFLVQGFTHGFPLEYHGPLKRKSRAKNLPFTIGNRYILWEKIMKEIKAGQYVRPYADIPFKNYIQSPIGLVPKDGGRATRLIFHQSYNFSENLDEDVSLNYFTPRELCTVHYKDLDYAIQTFMKFKESQRFFLSKTDLRSAFCRLPILAKDHWLLCMQATHPTRSLKALCRAVVCD